MNKLEIRILLGQKIFRYLWGPINMIYLLNLFAKGSPIQCLMHCFLNISDYFLFFVVACSPGSHYNSDNKDCSLCEVGTYQPRPRKGACLPCAPGQVTLGRGATRRQDCCKSHYVMSTCRCCWRLLVAFCGTITACSPNVMCHVTYLLLVLGSLLCFFGFSGFYLFLMKKHPRNLYTDSSFFCIKYLKTFLAS